MDRLFVGSPKTPRMSQNSSINNDSSGGSGYYSKATSGGI